jgi:hypothetical protein
MCINKLQQIYLFFVLTADKTRNLHGLLYKRAMGTGTKRPEGKFLVDKFEFGGSFGMSLEGDCHEVESTPNLELLVTFGMSSEGVCHELYS